MGPLLELLFGENEDRDTRKKKKLEREMEAYGLLEEEKKLVRSGEYDPWDFDEEELDEDSYYSDR